MRSTIREKLEHHGLNGSPAAGLWTATLGLFAGLTTIVFYGVTGPEFQKTLGLSGASLGLLLSSPHLSKAILRVPFGAWVDEVGGKKPFLVLLLSSLLGMLGLIVCLFSYYPHNFDQTLYPALLLAGLLGGAGAATFSVGVPQVAYWYKAERQGWALGVYAGLGNIGPGVFSLLIPVLMYFFGMEWAYLGWWVFLALVTWVYASYAHDSYFFQLRDRGLDVEQARAVASELGQEFFPSASISQSLKTSARNPRTWVLVFLYSVSFGGGFTAMATWLPTYWAGYHQWSLVGAGCMAAIFTVYGSLIRIWGGSLSDRHGGEVVAAVSFLLMALGAGVLSFSSTVPTAFGGMMILASGMGVANAAIFELVPKYVPQAVGGASGWIGGLGGAATLVILPLLGTAVDHLGSVGYARGFLVYVALSTICALIAGKMRPPKL